MKPRRSVLSVPGHVEKMHAKALGSQADVVMLDLEDSVPLDQKEAARQQVIASLLANDWSGKVVAVRINSLDTPYAYRDLVDVVEAAGQAVDSIVVPKVDHCGDIHFVSRMLDGIELHKKLDKTLGIEASIETAQGLNNVDSIASASPRVIALVFGVADYTASVGARLVSISGHGENEAEIYPGHRWHYVLSKMVMTAKAHGLLAIDAPYGHYKDLEGLRAATAMVSALGCDGKWAIHPTQLEVINQVFTPAPEDIERARQIIQASATARHAGRGAIAVDGRMVDQATLRLAEKLWSQAKHLGLVEAEEA